MGKEYTALGNQAGKYYASWPPPVNGDNQLVMCGNKPAATNHKARGCNSCFAEFENFETMLHSVEHG